MLKEAVRAASGVAPMPSKLNAGDCLVTRCSGAWPEGSVGIILSVADDRVTLVVFHGGAVVDFFPSYMRGDIRDWEHGWHVFARESA